MPRHNRHPVDPHAYAGQLKVSKKLRLQIAALIEEAIAASNGKIIETRLCACGCSEYFRVGRTGPGYFRRDRIYATAECKRRCDNQRRAVYHARRSKRKRKQSRAATPPHD